MATPYTFEPVIPAEEAFDLGVRLASGRVTLRELKDACGIAGCVCEKYDGDPLALAAYGGGTLEELGGRLRDMATVPEDAEAAFDVTLWLPLILRIIELIISRIGGRNQPSPTPGPV